MTVLTLPNIPPVLLDEWTAYARQSGLPLEYLILEAVTYSVRSDRLGVEAAKLICAQRQKTLILAKKHVQKNGSSPQEPISGPTTPAPAVEISHSDDSSHLGQVVHNLSPEYMDSDESSAALDDFVPRNL